MLKKLWKAVKGVYNWVFDLDTDSQNKASYRNPNVVSVSKRNWNEYIQTVNAIQESNEYMEKQEREAQRLSPEAIQSWRENNARVDELFRRRALRPNVSNA